MTTRAVIEVTGPALSDGQRPKGGRQRRIFIRVTGLLEKTPWAAGVRTGRSRMSHHFSAASPRSALPPDSDYIADIPAGPSGANSAHHGPPCCGSSAAPRRLDCGDVNLLHAHH